MPLYGPPPLSIAAVNGVASAAATTAAGAAASAAAADLAAYRPFPVPAHAGPRTGRFDPIRCVYNWKASNTRKIKTAMGLGGYFGTTRGSVGVLADSASEAQVGTSTWNQQFAWPIVAYNSLVAGGSLNTGGAGGVIPSGYHVPLGSGATNGIDPRVARTGTWLNNTNGYISSTVDASTLTFPLVNAGVPTVKVEGTIVDVAYEKQAAGGTFTVSIDGAAAVSVNTAGTAGTYGHYTVTGLADQAHSVVITKTGTASVRILGLSVYRAYGFMVHNLARSGSTAEEWSTLTAGGLHEHRANSMPPNTYTGGGVLGGMFISLGANDMFLNGRTAAQVKAYLQNLRALWSGADVVLVNYPESQEAFNGTLTEWANFNRMYYDLADEWDCPLIDTYAMTGGWTVANGNGIMSGDTRHPNTRHQAALGARVASLLAA